MFDIMSVYVVQVWFYSFLVVSMFDIMSVYVVQVWFYSFLVVSMFDIMSVYVVITMLQVSCCIQTQ